MNKVTWISIIVVLIIALGLLSFRPVPDVAEENCLQTTGTVVKISEAGEYDVVFTLNETDTKFYINRGLEKGLSLEKLNADLQGQEVSIKYPKYWTLLDPLGKIKHIAQLEVGDTTIYSKH